MSWDLRLYDGKDVVFVGKGKGRAYEGFKKFVEKHSQALSITGVDKENGKSLEFLHSYDAQKTIFVKNEGIPGSEMPVPYTTAMQLFFSLVKSSGATTIGITGTKGKSTTTALTAHILKSAGETVELAGNIGISPLDALDDASPDTIFVLELSSYQLSDLDVSPHISACINLYNDHTDWHGSLESYYEAKHNIMRYARAEDLFIYNPDFSELKKWAERANCRTKAISKGTKLDISAAKLYGEHNRLNALIAREIALELGVNDNDIKQAINSFEPLPHRMQYVAEKGNKIYIDDAIGMTPESTTASLNAVTEKYGPVGCLLLGGQDRNYDFTELLKTVAAHDIPFLVLFPDTINKMRGSLPKGYGPEIYEASNMAEAVSFAASHAPDKTVVLLSTGAPSYSLWKDFEDKGTQFQQAVREL